MAKTLNTRVQHKYDTETNWGSATFVPLRGELIVYGDPENTTTPSQPKLKIGDGTTKVGDLKFIESSNETGLPKPEENGDYIFNFNGNTWVPVKITVYTGEVSE